MSYKEQITSKDKHPSIFSPQMKVIVSIILQIFSQRTQVVFVIHDSQSCNWITGQACLVRTAGY